GTPNAWGSLAMTLVADNQWEALVTFDGQTNQRFKFDVKGDWTQNYGDSNKDGVADLTGSDIYTTVTGQYRVRFNDQTLQYSLTPVSVCNDPAVPAQLSGFGIGLRRCFHL
ncbi:hypothetical protein ACVVI8_004890, partial [Escherichia coli]